MCLNDKRLEDFFKPFIMIKQIIINLLLRLLHNHPFHG